ncbi:MAG TPA: NADH-quinone oxidoreductase subunit C [Candidatus Omnitrophota bacterium]|nr:NADH-quinone oxidoreductase subunit C [Candidatus Omnitrophota bacterium]HPT07835.1 NADH-quinone oxidoreductase subunit C [Candidatus Omnitrophota bacterium]
MIEEQKTMQITPEQLAARVQEMANSGYRLVQICCTKLPETIEINYSFDKDFVFENLRIELSNLEKSIPSISSVYWNAFLYENEMHDLYGVNIKGIVIDYKGSLYKTSIKTPFNPQQEISGLNPGGSTPKEEGK